METTQTPGAPPGPAPVAVFPAQAAGSAANIMKEGQAKKACRKDLPVAVENPHHSALEYSLERGGSNDISRVVSYGVCYLLLISIV